MNKPLPNFSPEELQCIGCDCIKPADEIEWEIHDIAQTIVCIDCASDMDTYLEDKRKYSRHKEFKRNCTWLDRSPGSDWVTCRHIENPTALQVCSYEHCPKKKEIK